MSAIKVCMKYMPVIENADTAKALARKLSAPLVTLLSAEPEIQYVALRNIHLIVQKKPEILRYYCYNLQFYYISNEVRVFFCKYNDPIYVKMEKLEIMIKLASSKNVDQVLMEFKEYATEVDIDFVRKAVRAIGRCAIKLESAAERCINVLLELIQTKVNFVVQEAIVVIKDIFRKYPNRYESIIADLCENLEQLDESEAKASMVWIIGEYADRIDNADELLQQFVENFQTENTLVQLQLLTAVVKFFLKKPDSAKDLVTKVLNLATENSDNPDLRDRGFVYWRLLSTDPEAAHRVVLAERPTVNDDTYQIDGALLDTLISNISTLSSVYHKPPESFVKGGHSVVFNAEDESSSDSGSDEDNLKSDDVEDAEEVEEEVISKPKPGKQPPNVSGKPRPNKSEDIDILGIGNSSSNSGKKGSDDLDFIFGGGSAPAKSSNINYKVAQLASAGNGLQISTAYSRVNSSVQIDLKFENFSNQPLSQFALRLNPDNYVGLALTNKLALSVPLNPNSSVCGSVLMTPSGNMGSNQAPVIQLAIKTELGVSYFNDNVPGHLLFEEDGKIDGPTFVANWKSMSDDLEQRTAISEYFSASIDDIIKKLEPFNIFFTAKRNVESVGLRVYFSTKMKGTSVLLELTVGSSSRAAAKSTNKQLSVVALKAIVDLVQK